MKTVRRIELKKEMLRRNKKIITTIKEILNSSYRIDKKTQGKLEDIGFTPLAFVGFNTCSGSVLLCQDIKTSSYFICVTASNINQAGRGLCYSIDESELNLKKILDLSI